MTIYCTKTTDTTYTRCIRGTAGSIALPVWSRTGKFRMPKVGETFDTFVDGSTLYAVCYR